MTATNYTTGDVFGHVTHDDRRVSIRKTTDGWMVTAFDWGDEEWVEDNSVEVDHIVETEEVQHEMLARKYSEGGDNE